MPISWPVRLMDSEVAGVGDEYVEGADVGGDGGEGLVDAGLVGDVGFKSVDLGSVRGQPFDGGFGLV